MKLSSQNHAIINARTHALLMAFRQALIMCLGAIEDYLEMERSIVPRHKRRDEQSGDYRADWQA